MVESREENSLIERCKENLAGAFDEFVLKYHRKVFNIAYRFLNNYDEANDTAQEVFVRAWRAIKGFRQESNVFTWLYRITVNLSKNRLKTLNRERKTIESLDNPIETEEGEIKREIPENKPSSSQVLVEKERSELIRTALISLNNKFREVIVLRDIEGLSYEEIAQILKVNIGTVRSRLHRARMILKERLKGVLR